MNRELIANLRFDESKLKKISSFVVLAVLTTSLLGATKGETICNPGAVEYHQRVYEYQQERIYDENIKQLYDGSQINIDGVLLPIDKFFITIK